MLFAPYRLVLVEGRFNFEGLSTAAAARESWSVGALFVYNGGVGDIRDLDGSRVVEGSWEGGKSLPTG